MRLSRYDFSPFFTPFLCSPLPRPLASSSVFVCSRNSHHLLIFRGGKEDLLPVVKRNDRS